LCTAYVASFSSVFSNVYILELRFTFLYIMLKFYLVTMAHHVDILAISFLIMINIQIIVKYYLIVLIGYLLTLMLV